MIYEYQEDTQQIVRIRGDTAVVTALLRSKGVDNGKPFEHKLWFSNIYVRTSSGWRYAFGQASLGPTNFVMEDPDGNSILFDQHI